MPQGSTKFQSSWLSAIVPNGQTVRNWCRRGKSDQYAYCRVCDTEFRADNAGKSLALKHAKGKVPKQMISSATENSQSKLFFSKKGHDASSAENQPSTSTSSDKNVLNKLPDKNVHGNEVLFK